METDFFDPIMTPIRGLFGQDSILLGMATVGGSVIALLAVSPAKWQQIGQNLMRVAIWVWFVIRAVLKTILSAALVVVMLAAIAPRSDQSLSGAPPGPLAEAWCAMGFGGSRCDEAAQERQDRGRQPGGASRLAPRSGPGRAVEQASPQEDETLEAGDNPPANLLPEGYDEDTPAIPSLVDRNPELFGLDRPAEAEGLAAEHPTDAPADLLDFAQLAMLSMI
jgi:hypothetical protein